MKVILEGPAGVIQTIKTRSRMMGVKFSDYKEPVQKVKEAKKQKVKND